MHANIGSGCQHVRTVKYELFFCNLKLDIWYINGFSVYENYRNYLILRIWFDNCIHSLFWQVEKISLFSELKKISEFSHAVNPPIEAKADKQEGGGGGG